MSSRGLRSGGVVAGGAGGKASALADLARLRREGNKGRLAAYEVEEADAIYDEVDEETYKAIAAEKRKEARDFVQLDSDDSDYSDYLEEEFEYEDEESRIKTLAEIRKRKRDEKKSGRSHKNGPAVVLAPTRRVNAAFFGKEDELDDESSKAMASAGPSILDSMMQDDVLEKEIRREKHRRRQAIAHKEWEKYGQLKETEDYDLVLGAVAAMPSYTPHYQLHQSDDQYYGNYQYSAPPPSRIPGAAMMMPPPSHQRLHHDSQNSLPQFSISQANPVETSKKPTGTSFPVRSSAPNEAEPMPEPIGSVAMNSDHEDDAIVMDSRPEPSVHINPVSPVVSPAKRMTLMNPGIQASTFSRLNESVPVVLHRDLPPPMPFVPPPMHSDAALKNAEFSQLASRAGELLLYWYDAQEVRSGGGDQIFLFCKAAVGSIDKPKFFANVTLHVKGLERVLYFLPRETKLGANGKATDEKVQIKDVHEEVMSLMHNETRVPEFKAKKVERAMPFDDADAPKAQHNYLKVKYSMDYAALPVQTSGKTFKRIYGCKSSGIQRLLVKRKMMGPAWIRVADVELCERIAYTKFVVRVDSPEKICVMKDQPGAPPLTVLALSFKMVLHPKTNQHEIAVVAGVLMPEVSSSTPVESGMIMHAASAPNFVAVRPVNHKPVPIGIQEQARTKTGGLELVPNEQALLNFVLAKVMKLDPDVILGHDLTGFGLDVFLNRLASCKTRDWSRIGRLIQRKDLNAMVKSKLGNHVPDALAGRLVLDTLVSAKELCPREKDYSIPALAESLLNRKLHPRTDALATPIAFEYEQTLNALLRECVQDAEISLQLSNTLSVLPLSRQLTSLSGNVWSKTLRGARAERIEFLLCHELALIKPKLLLPDKLSKYDRKALEAASNPGSAIVQTEEKAGRRKPQYAGGLVLEPKKGLYDRYVLQLDFNSLYPSIIQEYNICFTTMDVDAMKNKAEDEIELPEAGLAEGVLPRVLRRLVEQRRAVKAVMKKEQDAAKVKQLDIRQLAIKLTANSLYGCLGFENSRFFARPLAQLITLQGRETLQRTIDLARDSFNAEVIYGDTDSLFVYTGLEDMMKVRALGTELKREVNKRYKTLEIEIDAVYARMLLLKKKKYAAMKVASLNEPQNLVREVKGLDLVRHDWCGLSRMVSSFAVDQLLSKDLSADDAIGNVLTNLDFIANQVMTNQIALQQYIITRSLTKAPEEYPDAQNLPHVQVALRRRAAGLSIRPGDYIQYVICKPPLKLDDEGNVVHEPSGSIAKRAFHPDEVNMANSALEIDYDYYLVHQILPPLSRLFDPIEGVDTARLAGALGLDASKFVDRSGGNSGAGNADGMDEFLVSNEFDGSQYDNCEPFDVVCGGCAKKWSFDGSLYCPICNRSMTSVRLSNLFTIQVRKWTQKYYCSPFVIDKDDGSEFRTDDLSLTDGRNQARRAPDADERWLFTQLRYVLWLVDNGLRKLTVGESETTLQVEKRVNQKRELDAFRISVQAVMEHNAFHFVDLGELFESVGLGFLNRTSGGGKK